MAPTTRSRPSEDVIVVHDSDSEPEILENHSPKRQKTGFDNRRNTNMSDDMDVDIELQYPNTSDSGHPNGSAKTKFNTKKNTHLKGRRRFNADLEDMKTECIEGLVIHGHVVKKIRSGDDEGAFELVICDEHGKHVLAVNILTSDTSDYPSDHSFFSYSTDSDLPPDVAATVESIGAGSPRTIHQVVEKLLGSLGGSQVESQIVESQEVEMEDEGSGDDYDSYDIDDDLVAVSNSNVTTLNRERLQNDFIETIATSYRPGFIRFAGDDFSLSISVPVITLANSIPPRALMAWDRRLLSRHQHLTLLILGIRGMYPPLEADGTYTSAAHRIGAALTFQVGLTSKYKPGKEAAKEAGRTFGLITQDAEDELRIQAEKAAAFATFDPYNYDYDSDYLGEAVPPLVPAPAEAEPEDEGRFDKFSLSSALESLMDQAFLKVVQLRRKFGLGWAGAELLLSETEKAQRKPEDVYREMLNKLTAADKEEAELARTNVLPHDPLLGLGANDGINLPLTAFCYLVRRLSLCTRYCIVCHNRLTNDYEALKPYVCDSKLCAYQYYSLNRGPSLEYEIIHNPQTVDLLVSIAHSAASEGVMEDPLPVGMGLRVPQPDSKKIPPSPHLLGAMPGFGIQTPAPVAPQTEFILGPDGLGDFDDLSLALMRVSIADMISSLPSVEDMKKHLERKVKAGKSKPKLKDLDPTILPAAWSILRWCVASCTSYLEEITSGDERVHGLDPAWRQFRFSVGAPDAEAKFKASVRESQSADRNAQKYPSLYAFHGSALRNWHSIIRHGLWYKQVTNGRAYGDGVYLAKEGSISMGSYAAAGRSTWSKSKICPTNCVALTEIVNLPMKFVSHNPYFVIKDTHWIMCRYLLVKGVTEASYDAQGIEIVNNPEGPSKDVPLVKLDPKHPVTLSNRAIQIPEPSHQIDALLQARSQEYREDENDEDDCAIFAHVAPPPEPEVIEVHDDDGDDHDQYDLDDEDDYNIRPSKPAAAKGKGKAAAKPARPADDWTHDPEWVNGTVEKLMPPPVDSTPSATMAVQRELRAMLTEQEGAPSLRELGWYMPPALVGDNLFQWIVELHSFDEKLPIAKDMRARNLNSIIFEIRFPPSFPLAPPFFRIVAPRFLPFIQGGGGHVTGGGSICMDLLTADGWLPSYSIAAILLQIKLAISNLDPRPARLASNFDQAYEVHEALTGYKRAAATHGWQVPVGIDKLVR